MKVNVNIVEKLVGFKLPPVDELVARVNAQLGGVEEIIDLGAKYGAAKINRMLLISSSEAIGCVGTCSIGNDQICVITHTKTPVIAPADSSK